MLTLNLIVNCVTLVSSLLLITGAIKVRHARPDLDFESGLNIDNHRFYHFSGTRCSCCLGWFAKPPASSFPRLPLCQKALKCYCTMRTSSKASQLFWGSAFWSESKFTCTCVSTRSINYSRQKKDKSNYNSTRCTKTVNRLRKIPTMDYHHTQH